MVLSLEDIIIQLENDKIEPSLKLKLAVDAYRIHLKHLFDPLSCVAIGRIDPLPHQIESFVKMMSMLRPHGDTAGRIRVLLADDVGLGKTIMIGMVLKELLLSSRIKKVLIVCPAGLQLQWREELFEKFGEDFEIIRGRIGIDNPFKIKNKVITSMDYAKNPKKLELLKDTHWDLVIIDEAHKLKTGNMRYELGEVLSENCSHLILATATPHDGKLDNFLSLLGLLDQNLRFTDDRFELMRYLDPMMIRRMKNEITNFKGQGIFPEREEPYTIDIDFNFEEEEFYDAVGYYVNKYYRRAADRKKTSAVLALYILHRMVSSSIYAGLQALKNRKNRLWEPFIETKDESVYFENPEDLDASTKELDDELVIGSTASLGDELKEEFEELDELISMGQRLVDADEDSKSKKLIEGLKEVRNNRPGDKIILFTEFRPTLAYLKRILSEEDFSVVDIHGGMDIKEREMQRDKFEYEADILIGTDAISEGLNLQFANIVVNYELPWNPNRLEQRIGRAYRYGQEKPVFVYNYKTGFAIDNHVLEKLVEKLEEIRLAFGDRTVDVIGSLISESEMMEIFRIARTVGDTDASDKVRGLIDEKLSLIDNIEQYMIKTRFDLTEVLRASRNMEMGVVKFDIERFLLSYLTDRKNGNYDPIGKNTYILFIENLVTIEEPSCSKNVPPYRNKTYDFNGTFDKDSDRRNKYVALGDPALNMALHNAMSFKGISALEGKEDGLLFPYIIRFFDSLGKEVYAEPILILKNKDGFKVMDSIQIWDFDSLEIDSIPDKVIDLIDLDLNNIKNDITPQIQELNDFAKLKHQKDLELDLKRLNADFECRIAIEERNIRKAEENGQKFLISSHEGNIKSLRTELQLLVSELDSSREVTWKLCGPLSCGIVLKPELEKGVSEKDIEAIEQAKKEVEKAGVDYVIQKEKEWGRETVYNSLDKEEFKGYDVLTKSDYEERMIEIKSFKTEGPIHITSNEWRTASENPDNFYLYVVKNALDYPELIKINDPYNNLSDVAKKIHFDDYKVIIDLSSLNRAIETTKPKLVIPEVPKEETNSEIKEQLTSSYFIDWLETLPYPLSSILWKYYAERDVSKQIKILFNYFEALCEFHGIILASIISEALKKDPNILEDPNILNDRIEWITQTSFGKWHTFGSRIAKKIRLFGSSDSKNYKFLFEKILDITGQKRDFIELITNKQLYNLFKDVKDYRNKYKGHGGDSSEKIDKEILEYLEKQLYRSWRAISNIYSDNILIIPDGGSRLEDHYQYDVMKIIGTRVPFITMKLSIQSSLHKGSLYLLNKDRLKPLQILPFFKIIESPKTGEKACYFYREVDESTIRWISYHYGNDPELSLPLERDLKKAIEILLPIY